MPIAAAARAQGIIIYCIGLSGNGGIDVQARNISKPGATNIVINDIVSPCFKITSLSAPTKGTASLLDSNSLLWKIDELGVSKSEGAALEFTVEHIGPCSGTIEVNESVDYDDPGAFRGFLP